MIVGVGVDLIEIKRIEAMLLKNYNLEKLFTADELNFSNKNATSLAGNFAIKEAVSKVFGTGFFGVEPSEIEVLRDDNGAPFVKLYGNARKMAEKKGIHKIHVSITNTDKYAQGFAVGERL